MTKHLDLGPCFFKLLGFEEFFFNKNELKFEKAFKELNSVRDAPKIATPSDSKYKIISDTIIV